MTPAEVAERYSDIRRIVVSGFRSTGLDMDDLVQEVALRMVRYASSPGGGYDPSRGSFSNYVHQVAWSASTRMGDQEGRRRRLRAVVRAELRAVVGEASADWAAGAASLLDEDAFEALRGLDLPDDWDPDAPARGRQLQLLEVAPTPPPPPAPAPPPTPRPRRGERSASVEQQLGLFGAAER